jgi:hypothetical protein
MTLPQEDERVIFVIGDLHLIGKDAVSVVEHLSRCILEAVTLYESKCIDIVLLGDILHDHGRVSETVLCATKTLVDTLRNAVISKKGHLFILRGNHDMGAPNLIGSYQTILEVFNGLPGVIVCNKPDVYEVENTTYRYAFLPYGTTVEQIDNMRISGGGHISCCFAHYEVTEWPVTAPLLLAGHIHKASRPQSNLLFTGAVHSAHPASEIELIPRLYVVYGNSTAIMDNVVSYDMHGLAFIRRLTAYSLEKLRYTVHPLAIRNEGWSTSPADMDMGRIGKSLSSIDCHQCISYIHITITDEESTAVATIQREKPINTIATDVTVHIHWSIHRKQKHDQISLNGKNLSDRAHIENDEPVNRWHTLLKKAKSHQTHGKHIACLHGAISDSIVSRFNGSHEQAEHGIAVALGVPISSFSLQRFISVLSG